MKQTRIVVEITEDTFAITPDDKTSPPDIATKVVMKIDGERDRGIEQRFTADFFNSRFDIIWETIGRKLKEGIGE